MPASTKYKSQELVAELDGQKIYGQLFLPGKPVKEPLPCVVCAHGFGQNYLHNVPYAWYLAERGYAVYCFDFRGGGYASRSEGNPIEMTLSTEVEDYEAVLDMLREHPLVDARNIFVMGEGQGGFVATVLANRRPNLMRGLVLLYPAFQMHDDARRSFPTKKNIPVSYRLMGMRVGRAFGECAWDTNPYTQMRGYPGEVLVLHGDEDATCLIEYSERAVEVFPHARLETIHGAKHVFRERYLERACELIKEFVDAQRVEGPAPKDAVEKDADEPRPARHAAEAEPTDATSKPPRHSSERTSSRYNPNYVARVANTGRHFKRS